jgi:predicted metalloprotease with PDZ domain
MLQYNLSYNHPHRHFIDIQFCIDNHNSEELILQLPAWRPGRYELGNFAKNIQYFKVTDANGNSLKFKKITKDSWKVSTVNISDIFVSYNYYANELNAGSTYLDENQLYVNGVNCLLFIPNRMEEECTVDLHIPDDYQIACSLKKEGKRLLASNFDELVESPWVASASLQHNSYKVEGIKFHIWFQGTCAPDWSRILKDFKAFTIEQIKDFTAFPVSEYHFINQILPYKAYHGVEHTASTVISLGPGEDLMGEKLYDALLGVSSHELYHTWNVKKIRPEALLPYDYSKENYSRMGYLYEGVTTYMGDLYLKRSKVFSDQEFYKTQEENLVKHFHNGGRHNMSIADSSFDTWLDGYVMGIPNRKVSIYTEGALCALMLDIHFLKKSNGQVSLRDLMTRLYRNYACKGKGLSEEDYIHELISYGADKALEIVENYIYGTKDFRVSLDEALSLVGLQIVEEENKDVFASCLGLKTLRKQTEFHIKQVLLDSVADKSRIAEGDIILSIDGEVISKDLLSTLKVKDSAVFKLKRRFETVDIELSLKIKSHYPLYKIVPMETITNNQKSLFEAWLAC